MKNPNKKSHYQVILKFYFRIKINLFKNISENDIISYIVLQ